MKPLIILKVKILQVEVKLQKKSQSQNPQTQFENQISDAEEDDQQSGEDLSQYTLVKDRKRRDIKPPNRYGHADLIWYALAMAEHVDKVEPRNHKDAKTSKNSNSGLRP